MTDEGTLPVVPTAPAMPRNEHLKFHGSGVAYFRIWVVNLFLTLITLGIYSAWAKVRKARWFAQQTSLGGDRFDYHGDPRRILLGRVVAVGLFVLWTFAFDLSPLAGLAVLALFCVVGPVLFASAQRFRLVNTSWRGLRFGFDVPRAKVYAVCVPLLLMWTAGSALSAMGVEGVWVGLASVLTFVGFPWAHARLKQMQHHHARYGNLAFSYTAGAKPFYGLYLKAMLLTFVAAIVVVPVLVLLGMSGVKVMGSKSPIAVMAVGVFMALAMWVCAWPYFAARMQQIVWARTQLGDVRFLGHMKGWPLLRLVLKCTVLTLLTAGLYWPFAAVAIARYRVEAIEVLSDRSLDELEATRADAASDRPAVGDAAADFFGLDLGW